MVTPELAGPATPDQIQTFLSSYVPSANSSADGKWFVARSEESEVPLAEQSFRSRFNKFKSEVYPFENEILDNCDVIAEHAPVRGNKKSGTRSQKDLREHEHAKFHYHLEEIAAKHGIVGGAWIMFFNPDEVDPVWKRIVEELVSDGGQLAASGATYAKCASTYGDRNPPVIWVWVEDASDITAVESVFRVLVEMCGFAPTSFKTDAMSILGINSKHRSKIRVSKFAKLSFMTRKELDAALEQYATRGPASSISPLSGPPEEPEIDWDFTFEAPADQPVLAATPSPKKKRKVDLDVDDVDWIPDVAPSAPRPSRRAAQKAAEILKQQADESNARKAERAARESVIAADTIEDPADGGASLFSAVGGPYFPGCGRLLDEDVVSKDEAEWMPEPEDLAGGAMNETLKRRRCA
ncbi:hypothetical protein JCM10207_007515 [Rhodosporidiobolus poonsookiae]